MVPCSVILSSNYTRHGKVCITEASCCRHEVGNLVYPRVEGRWNGEHNDEFGRLRIWDEMNIVWFGNGRDNAVKSQTHYGSVPAHLNVKHARDEGPKVGVLIAPILLP